MTPPQPVRHGNAPWKSLRPLLALAIGNLVLTFENLWPTPAVKPAATVSIEWLMLAVALAAWVGVRGIPAARELRMASALFALLVIGRYADVTVPALLGRPINLYWDGRQLPQVLALGWDVLSAWTIVAAGAVLLGAVLMLYRVLRWSIGVLAAACVEPRPRRATIAIGLGLATAVTVGHLASLDAINRHVAVPVTATFARQLNFLATALWSRRTEQLLPASPVFDANLDRLRRADVLLVFLESYGATTFDNPAYARRLASQRAALDRAVTGSGRRVVSAFVGSPTFGGGSWLAHASLLAGIDVRDPTRYDLLLTTSRPTLVRHFAGNGYQTVALMPGLRASWPEGAFYGFDALYDGRTLGYHGPEFGFWKIPDQYALAKVDALELQRPGRRPVFVVFPTISSHIPFRPVPPYRSDWSKVLSGQAFNTPAADEANAGAPDWTDLAPGYLDSVAYSIEWLAGYLRDRAPRDTVLIVLGDHQPVSGVSGRDAPWEVPVHIIASQPELLERFVMAGFKPGMQPVRPALGAMHDLTRILVAAFDARPAGVGVGASQSAALSGAPSATTPGESSSAPSRVNVARAGAGGQRGKHLADSLRLEPLRGGQSQRLAH